MQDFVRFRKITPPEVPPTGCVDLAYDFDSSSFIARMPDGTTETIGSGSALVASEGGNGAADEGKVAAYNSFGNLRGTLVTAGAEAGTFGLDYCVVLTGGGGAFSAQIDLYKGSNRFGIRADDITGNRTLQAPDINGRIAVSSTTSYADDSAAQAAGLAVGDLYFTGTKFRVRMV